MEVIGGITVIITVIVSGIALYRDLYSRYNNRQERYYNEVLNDFYLKIMKDNEKIEDIKNWIGDRYEVVPMAIAILLDDPECSKEEILKMLLVDYIENSCTIENALAINMRKLIILISHISFVSICTVMLYNYYTVITNPINNISDAVKSCTNKIIGVMVYSISLAIVLIIGLILISAMIYIFYISIRNFIKSMDPYDIITLDKARNYKKCSLSKYDNLCKKKLVIVDKFKSIYVLE